MNVTPCVGPVLILGGCGFVGSHIVRYFVSEGTFPHVAVLSRSAAEHQDRITGVKYLSGDITNENHVRSIFSAVKPVAIINTASPSPTTGTNKQFRRVAIEATKLLLRLAIESPYVRAFIYTSSTTLARGREHINLTEDVPLADTDHRASPYARSKAKAEILVLKANAPPPIVLDEDYSSFLKTGAIRLPIVYGTHDPWTIPGCLQALKYGQHKIRIGNGRNEWHFCSSENSGKAHFLLTRGLLDGQTNGYVDGHAFNITDGDSVPFWDFSRAVWKAAGYDSSPHRILKIPAAVILPVADLLELCVRTATFGRKRPKRLGRQQVEYIAYTHTYNIAKAGERLGYVPEKHFEEQLEKAVCWQLEQRGRKSS